MQTQERPAIENQPQTEKRYYTPEEYLALEESAIDLLKILMANGN